jgi:hypothetical protein
MVAQAVIGIRYGILAALCLRRKNHTKFGLIAALILTGVLVDKLTADCDAAAQGEILKEDFGGFVVFLHCKSS